MSDSLKHECGIALIRLLKPLQYFADKYGNPLYGFNKLFLLMEKQHNRGQDGAGIGTVKLNMPQGEPYMFRQRDVRPNALMRIFDRQMKRYDAMVSKSIIIPELAPTVKQHFDFGGEALIGHLRYGTSGNYNRACCHPYFRRSNWPTRNLMVLGNFNMTNSGLLNQKLIERGQHPIFDTDTQTILEEIGFHLDEEHNTIYREMRDSGVSGEEIPSIISEQINLAKILRESSKVWDGGYTIAGLIGNGDAFVMRDPHGIRPCFYFKSSELMAFASERVPLMTVFDMPKENIRELKPGHVVIIKKTGKYRETRFAEQQPCHACTFERIYFSRGNDPDIYNERKALGAALVSPILEKVDDDMKNTVFSYVPNTAETAYYGLMDELRLHRRRAVKTALLDAAEEGEITEALLDDLIMDNWPRGEKVAHKDIKLRTFISQEKGRNKMVSHIYDVTHDLVKSTDNLVVLDDSIVRGTTLKRSIIKMLSRANPKKIVIASTAPQIRYPDCYGIDMSELSKFIAFQAAVSLLVKVGKSGLLQEVYQKCVEQTDKPSEKLKNYVRKIYDPFTAEEISSEIATMIYPADMKWKGEIVIIFQGLDDLRSAIPNHTGDWYFTGHYPTPGGYAVLNQAFIDYYEQRSGRSYDVKFPAESHG